MQGLILVICIHKNDIWLSDCVSTCLYENKIKNSAIWQGNIVQITLIWLYKLIFKCNTNIQIFLQRAC